VGYPYSSDIPRPERDRLASRVRPAAQRVTSTAPRDLSWVGDSTVGFAVTYSPEVREQVRTLDISKTGTNLLADSRLVWSQYVPAAPHGTRAALHACDTPFLTGNGQAVVCGNFTKSASGKRLSAVWLAYPLATPTRPRVIGSVQEPAGVSIFNGPISVNWTNPTGTEVFGSWNTSVGVVSHGESATEVTNYAGVIENGKVNPFPAALAPSRWPGNSQRPPTRHGQLAGAAEEQPLAVRRRRVAANAGTRFNTPSFGRLPVSLQAERSADIRHVATGDGNAFVGAGVCMQK
jgi:hypothetical protein